MPILWILFVWQPQQLFFMPVAYAQSEQACEASRSLFKGRTICGAVPHISDVPAREKAVR